MLRAATSSLRNTQRRYLHSSNVLAKAAILKMPAMSPTMTEGGISEWKIKEGDAYKSGDALLAVETDKAVIDVEAQDDGILAKIIKGDGSKGIKVGVPIAVTADPGDDLKTLELPEVKGLKSAPKTETKKEDSKASTDSKDSSSDPQTLLPSVASLLEANGISRADALAKIKASGPNGRLLKGDVLAYLGKISPESVEKVKDLVNSHSKLDLSNIEKGKLDSKKNADGKKPKPKPEPVLLKKTFALSKFKNSTNPQAQSLSIEEFVRQASKRAETSAYKPAKVNSDYYDPVFEELIAPSNNLERFKVKLDLVSNPGESKASDPFLSLLSGSPLSVAPESNKESGAKVDVSVLITPGIADAEEKGKRYLSKLEEYLS